MSLSASKIVRLPMSSGVEFGKYQLVAKLGQGGMAEVFLAAHRGPLGFEKLVVIKRLKPETAADADVHAMFLDEARIAARLNHPNVVQTYECGSVEEQNYLAMEYLEGQPLDRVLHRLGHAGLLAPWLAVVSDALAGLHHAHELADFDGTPLGVVHRDVSPHNVFITYEGQVKVVDFGIAKWASRSAQTSTGVVKGKIAYMAPEQALSAPVDRRADLFAMGVILWEVTTGDRFWGSLSEVQILQKMAFGEVPKLSERQPGAPEALARICGRALSIAPDGRYATAAEMRDDVEGLIAELGRRPTQAEIGRLVAEAFADRRAEAKAVIGEQLGRLDAGHAPAPEPSIDGRDAASIPVLDDRAGPPSVRGRSHREAGAGREATPFPGVTSPGTPVTGPHGRRGRFVVAGLLGLAVAAAGLFVALRREDAPAAGPPPAAAPAGPSGAPQAALIALRIAASPAGAKIFLDDVAVPSNPFSARFPRDGTGHRIRVEAEGYTAEASLVVFDRDVALDVALAPADPAAGAAPPDPVAHAGAGAAPPRTQPAGVARPGAPATSAPGPKVDTSDPWGKKRR